MKTVLHICFESLALLFVSCFSCNSTIHSAPANTAWNSRGYAPLKSFAAQYGFPAPSIRGKTITLKSKYTTMVFDANSRKLIFNGFLIWMNGPLVKEDGEWALAKADIIKTIEPLLSADRTLASVSFSRIVIDPGHGGRDSGAIGRRKVYEKKVVLDIAKRVRKKLQADGLNVKLTRERDSTLRLSARIARAREWGADIFVSIHCNSAHNTSAAGLETYVVPAAGFPSTARNDDRKTYAGNKHDAANTLLAYYVHKETLVRTKSADRGIRRARFDVIRDAPCPAILIECGFVSNKIEEERMLQRKYRDNVAEGIAQGIMAYINKAKDAASR